MILMKYGPEVISSSFYTPEFRTTTSKIQTQFLVLANNTQLYRPYAQMWNKASGTFVTVCAAPATSAVTTSIIFSDQDCSFSGIAWALLATTRMRWRVELSGTGAMALQVAVFELLSSSNIDRISTRESGAVPDTLPGM